MKMGERLKQITCFHLLAYMFIVLIFSIGVVAAAGLIYTKIAVVLKTERIIEIKNIIDSGYKNILPYKGFVWVSRGFYIDFNGLIASLLRQHNMNNVVKLNNGHLSTALTETRIDLSDYVKSIKGLNTYLNEKNIDFFYIHVPMVLCNKDPQLPIGSVDYSEDNALNFLQSMQDLEINIFNLHEEMHIDRRDHYASFFYSDPHWKPETAFWANTKILEHLEENGVLNLVNKEYLLISNYNITTYEKYYLGQCGKRTGHFFSIVDNFNLITPSFFTNIEMIAPNYNVNRKGKFEESVIDRNLLKRDDWGKNMYCVYTGGPYDITQFRNENAPIRKKLLLLSDSFSMPVSSFMSISIESIDMIFLMEFSGDIKEYIEDYKPDVVIMMYILSTYPVHLNKLLKIF
jgi:hypothetical protein